MAAEVSSIARMLRGETVKRGGVGPKSEKMVTMDLLGGCGGDSADGSCGDDEVVDLEVKVPVGWERRLDLLSGKTFLTPHRHQAVQGSHQDLNLPPSSTTATAATNTTTSAAVCTLDMVRSALERAAAMRSATSPATSSSSSASTSSSSSSLGKRNRSPHATATTESPPANPGPAMRAAACPSCLTYVLVVEADPLCPRCECRVPPFAKRTGTDGSGKKPRIDLNAAADETE